MKHLTALVIACAVPVCAAAKAPAPEFLVESRFQYLMAEHIVAVCPDFAFDHPAVRRHLAAADGRLSDLGVHAREINKRIAPIPLSRYERHFEAFFARHGMAPDSPDDAYCRAGTREHMRRTTMGLMLKRSSGHKGDDAGPSR
ncbi:MAG: DUF5333 domain-containing protein [Rhodobacteraceae bacterium]|nr:DUF5333 domain-containing protein [Paracoccaceae bacterium]